MKVPLAAALLALTMSVGVPAGAQSPAPAPAPSGTPAVPSASPVPAGIVPPAVTLHFAGTVTPRFVLARVRAAIDALAQRQPGTSLDIHGITLDGVLAPGASLDALAGIAIGGRGAYADVTGKTAVHVDVALLPPLEPLQLFSSDDPEYIPASSDGVLFRGSVAPDMPARIVLYHVARSDTRSLALVLQTTGAPAQVQLLGAAVGPNPFYAYVGQQTSARFLLAQATQESQLFDLAPDVPLTLPLGTLQPNELVEAIEDLRVVSGGSVTVSVVTAGTGAPDLATLLAEPELAGDGHGRRGAFALGVVPPIELSLTVGAPDPAPVRAGVLELPNLRPGGRPLGGDYGVVRRVLLHLANPSSDPQSVFLWERTEGGGGATVTMLFDGESAATTIPCVDDAVEPRLVRAFALAPGTAETIGATYLTDGASSYPIAFGLSLTPPLAIPPGACDGPPKPPAED